MASTAAAAKTASVLLDTGIAAKDRRKVADHLAEALADTYTLLVKTHVYHWNVVGPLFVPLHELLEDHYKNLFTATDVIAERIRALGLTTPLSFKQMRPKSDVDEETINRSAIEMVRRLVEDHETLCRSFREIAEMSEAAKDLVTTDLLTERLAFHEKAIWMLNAIVAK